MLALRARIVGPNFSLPPAPRPGCQGLTLLLQPIDNELLLHKSRSKRSGEQLVELLARQVVIA